MSDDNRCVTLQKAIQDVRGRVEVILCEQKGKGRGRPKKNSAKKKNDAQTELSNLYLGYLKGERKQQRAADNLELFVSASLHSFQHSRTRAPAGRPRTGVCSAS